MWRVRISERSEPLECNGPPRRCSRACLASGSSAAPCSRPSWRSSARSAASGSTARRGGARARERARARASERASERARDSVARTRRHARRGRLERASRERGTRAEGTPRDSGLVPNGRRRKTAASATTCAVHRDTWFMPSSLRVASVDRTSDGCGARSMTQPTRR